MEWVAQSVEKAAGRFAARMFAKIAGEGMCVWGVQSRVRGGDEAEQLVEVGGEGEDDAAELGAAAPAAPPARRRPAAATATAGGCEERREHRIRRRA